MTTRFVDERGTEWEVWEVRARRLVADAPPPPPHKAPQGDESWLCFESATQRRYLSTYPSWWHALPEHELDGLCHAARPERPSPALFGVVVAPRMR